MLRRNRFFLSRHGAEMADEQPPPFPAQQEGEGWGGVALGAGLTHVSQSQGLRAPPTQGESPTGWMNTGLE